MVPISWLRWWRRSAPARNPIRVVLYTRHGCHLCEEAWQLLQHAQKQHGLTLDAVDVDASPELAARYSECVPVVTVDGKVRFKGGVNELLLARLLRAEAKRRK